MTSFEASLRDQLGEVLRFVCIPSFETKQGKDAEHLSGVDPQRLC